jgi:predicted metal-dependent HD superfamily phosphohydrolase
MWHHLRPRYHQRGSSISTATLRVCPPCPLAAATRAGETTGIGDEAELRAAWTEAIGDDPAALAELDEVLARHRQPHRRYHGVRHVTWVVRHVHDLAASVRVSDLDAVVAAAFYHDAVYDPRASDNEEQSARLAERILGELGWNAARRCRVGDLVRATAAHAVPANPGTGAADADAAVLLDADLAVLGSDPAAYEAYAVGVRVEYAHVDDAAWREGRGQVLRALLARDPLYATAPARTRWAARAAANMTAELASL